MGLPSEKGDHDLSAAFERAHTVHSWDEDYYHPVAKRYYDRAIPEMLRSMGVAAGDELLDAGCGPGVHSIRAAQYGCRVTAIDFSGTMLTHAKQRSERAGVADRILFKQADLTRLALGRQFPFVFSWGVIIHIYEIEDALDGLAGAVAPGGRLALQVLNRRAIDFRLETLARRLLGKRLDRVEESALGTGNWYTYEGDRLWVMRFDPKGLTEALARRGFVPLSRRTAEFSEFQRRVPGVLRNALLHLNAAAYQLQLPADWSCTQILTFEKRAA